MFPAEGIVPAKALGLGVGIEHSKNWKKAGVVRGGGGVGVAGR